MAFLTVKNVRILGLSATVPHNHLDNFNDEYVDDAEKIFKNTGIKARHVAPSHITASDLCEKAATDLIQALDWKPEEIDCLVFVRQTPDYLLPSTSTILQAKLGLSEEAYCIDLAMGCSGYVYGLSNIAALLQNGSFKKALLLVGDTISKTCSIHDKSTYPLFGDAGTATALIFDETAAPIHFHFGTDGKGYEAIIVNEGGFRKPFKADSLIEKEVEEGISRSGTSLILEGMDVFSFGISVAPKTVNALMEKHQLSNDDIDNFFFHQANLFMNEKIRKKLKIDESKVSYSLENFGNTSPASIPLTMVSAKGETLKSEAQKNILCGFGVGLSWATAYLETSKLVIPEISYLS